MRDRLIELLKGAETEVNKALSGKSAIPLALEEWLGIYADHLIANGVILPPCKLGGDIYMLVTRNQHTFIKKTILTKLNFFDVIDRFGKTVFLTKEDAEKALAEGYTMKIYKLHGGAKTKLYRVWCAMKKRCNCPQDPAYSYYGGKGVKVCSEWENDFSAFREWAYKNGYKDGLSIDRIDVNGNYEPSNCRWVTMKTQANNQTNTLKIEYRGTVKTLHEWADILGIKAPTLYYRIYKLGWSIERAFTENVSFDRYHRRTIKENNNAE